MPTCGCTASAQKGICLELCILQGHKSKTTFVIFRIIRKKSEVIHHTIILTHINTIF